MYNMLSKPATISYIYDMNYKGFFLTHIKLLNKMRQSNPLTSSSNWSFKVEVEILKKLQLKSKKECPRLYWLASWYI
jgi:hypothetical protein